MTRNDTIYLYQDENKPKVQLTLIKTAMKLNDIINYFHDLQDLYNMEFNINETITENLKVDCSSPGINLAQVPFYIIEYDEIYDSFYIWKSNGNWNLNQIINTLYHLHNNTLNNHSWKRKFNRNKHFKSHPLKSMLISALNQLNLEWIDIDLNQFWSQFDSIYDHYIANNDSESINEYTLKSLISMAVLKLNVLNNKQYLKETFHQYYENIKTVNTKIDEENNNNIPSPQNIKDHVHTSDIEYSSPRSSVSPSPIDPLDNNLLTTKNSSYTYTYTNNKDKIKSQLLVNFNNHFKEVAENYENIQLNPNNKKLNSNHITNLKKNMNRITKLKQIKLPNC